MLVKLVEIYKSASTGGSGAEYSIREAFVNPDHVVCLREEEIGNEKIKSSPNLKELISDQQFTRIFLNRGQAGLDITVVGSLLAVQEKLDKNKKVLLKG